MATFTPDHNRTKKHQGNPLDCVISHPFPHCVLYTFPHNTYSQLPQQTVQNSVLPISPMAFKLKMVIKQSAYNSMKSSTRFWKH